MSARTPDRYNEFCMTLYINESYISKTFCVGSVGQYIINRYHSEKFYVLYIHSSPCLGCVIFSHFFANTVKSVLSGHLKIDKTKVLAKNGGLMKVESIAEWGILQYF